MAKKQCNYDYDALFGTVSNWDFGDGSQPSSLSAKSQRLRSYNMYDLDRTQSMFEWHGLQDSIPKWILEWHLQVNGVNVIFENEPNKPIICFGGWGGEPNEYYLPTRFIVSNPYLNIFREFNIGADDCVLAKNDTFCQGLIPLLDRYNSQLVENDITFNMADIMLRIQALISADTDTTKQSADLMLKQLVNGKFATVATSEFVGNVNVSPLVSGVSNTALTNAIEYHQYIKASKYNELGLQSNYNMKRESINSNEAQLNNDVLTPLIDDMLKCRKNICKEVNSKFGYNWSVELSSAWLSNKIEELQSINNGGDTDVDDTDGTIPNLARNNDTDSVNEETSLDNWHYCCK